MFEKTDTVGRRWVQSPDNMLGNNTGSSSSVLGVWLAPDEEVVWDWAHSPVAHVVGYSIVKKTRFGI